MPKENLDTYLVDIDDVTRFQGHIDVPHLHNHEKKHYTFSDVVTLNNTQTRTYYIVGSATRYLHIVYDVLPNTGSLNVDTFFPILATNNGTDMSNRISNDNWETIIDNDNVTDVQIFREPTAVLLGKYQRLWDHSGGNNNSRSSGLSRSDQEKIIPPNYNAVIRLTSNINSNIISVKFEWYEESKNIQ